MKKEMVISVAINNSSNSISSCFDSLLHPFQRKPDNCSRVLRIAVGTTGVDSVNFVGDDKSKIVVKGDGVDPVKLMKRLRKNMGYADLEKVSDVKPSEEKEDPPKPVPVALPPHPVGPPTIQILEEHPQYHEPVCCSIM